uniref:Nucleolar complex protein 2 homolog n=1 Tax=Chromera velia CCMP2878 TaxID=1169474 RepID=A0A0G4HPR4_9ALVE|eukprot:Cvel_29923.t1-p1 / transcript=Cvel_29923.t1 / gene=Cvel_29923 / organism=Chromera_velia_CCMP2878 / gene_product=Nucleolar complex protein 2, putative / transcript_product=Nucleolar complex protein 2, putative / location=Cvel_scaffold4185:2352-7892(-) / protein_length=901 / sequence_SO=supercontig / SO=protein_coding / is_pseudo=false
MEGDFESHRKELEALKEQDPDFYRFLLENDRELLEFSQQQPEGSDDEEAEAPAVDRKKKGKKGKAEAEEKEDDRDEAGKRRLTLERIEQIRASAIEKKTMYGLKLLVDAYRSACRAQEAAPDNDMIELKRSDQKTRKKKERAKRDGGQQKHSVSKKETTYVVDDDAAFERVVDLTVTHFFPLIDHHTQSAGKTNTKGGGDGKEKKGKKKGDKGMPFGDLPSSFSAWNRLRFFVKVFTSETTHLIAQVEANAELSEKLVSAFSDPQHLKFVLSLGDLPCERLVARLCRSWALSGFEATRFAAFLALRSLAALSALPEYCLDGAGARKKNDQRSDNLIAAQQVQKLLHMMYKAYLTASGRMGSFRSHVFLRFLENCLVEMLSVDEGLALRFSFGAIRQMASVVRRACNFKGEGAASRRKKSGGEGGQEKAMKKKVRVAEDVNVAIFSWPFIASARLLARVVTCSPKQQQTVQASSGGGSPLPNREGLRSLVFPLYTVLGAAIKLRLGQTAFSPFVFHLLEVLNKVSEASGIYIPISSLLLTLLESLENMLDTNVHSATSEARRQQGNKKKTKAPPKPPELVVTLRLRQEHLKQIAVAEKLLERLIFLIIDHLGLLARHPSFPEVSAPLVAPLRKASKAARSDAVRTSLRSVLRLISESGDVVRKLRSGMSVRGETIGVLLVLPATQVPLAVEREKRWEERREGERKLLEALEEGRRLQRELEAKEEAEKGLTPAQLKRRRQKERREEEAAASGKGLKSEEEEEDDVEMGGEAEEGGEEDEDEDEGEEDSEGEDVLVPFSFDADAHEEEEEDGEEEDGEDDEEEEEEEEGISANGRRQPVKEEEEEEDEDEDEEESEAMSEEGEGEEDEDEDEDDSEGEEDEGEEEEDEEEEEEEDEDDDEDME